MRHGIGNLSSLPINGQGLIIKLALKHPFDVMDVLKFSWWLMLMVEIKVYLVVGNESLDFLDWIDH